MKLHRPYIPLSVRVRVAHRQACERGFELASFAIMATSLSLRENLDEHLTMLFPFKAVALDHDPALVNRRQIKHRDNSISYVPDANDPAFLKYREAGKVGGGSEHDVKTRVRGERGQLSDLGLARKEKRRKKRADPKRRVQKIPARPFPAGRKLRSR